MAGTTDAAKIDHLRAALDASHKDRALVYHHVLAALEGELGQAEAIALMRKALWARGREIGLPFHKFAPDDFNGFAKAFAYEPDEGRLWQPEVRRCDAQGADLKFNGCPLKQAWQEAGLSAERVATLCHVASALDEGTLEAAGFYLQMDTWKQGVSGCCLLKIRRA